MIRSLKILVLAALAVTAFGAISASGAQALPKFHCSVSPCRVTLKPDGTGTTAHHVFIVEKGEASGSFTCKKLSGTGTASTGEVATLTIESLGYEECNIAGSKVTVDTAGCSYKFFSESEAVNLECTGTNEIKLTVGEPVFCTVTVPPQNLTGIKYHNIGSQAAHTTELTVETLVHNIKGHVGAGCKPVIGFENEEFTNGTYTTGNTIVTGETDPGGVMAETWWA